MATSLIGSMTVTRAGRMRSTSLVSPTWMFRPATALWTYVEQAALTGKQVVLVTTGNSRFDPPARTDTQVRVSASQNAHAMTF